MQLTTDQQKVMTAYSNFLGNPKEKYLIVQGSSGTGKSSLIKPIAELTEKHQKMCSLLLSKENPDEFEVILSATTNPAAAVVSELTNRKATTIHSILGLKMFNNSHTGKSTVTLKKDTPKIYNKVIIIDESSMMDGKLFEYIDAQTVNCKIVFICDWYQLAPVGYTMIPVQQLSNESKYTTVVMDKIMRNSGIIAETGQQFVETIKTGEFNPIPTGYPELVHANGDTFKSMIDNAFMDPNYASETAKVLAYTNTKVLQYTSYIRSIRGNSAEFQVGEKVITNNPILSSSRMYPIDSEVQITGAGCEQEYEDEYGKTGIVGRTIEINNSHMSFLPKDIIKAKQFIKQCGVEGKAKKNFSRYFYIKNNWMDLRSPYASTVHKAQGATYNEVFIDLPDIGNNFSPSDVARLLYVAITRAKDRVILYGSLPGKYGGTR